MFIDKSNKQGYPWGRQQDKRLRQQAALALDMLVVLPDYTISLKLRDDVGGRVGVLSGNPIPDLV